MDCVRNSRTHTHPVLDAVGLKVNFVAARVIGAHHLKIVARLHLALALHDNYAERAIFLFTYAAEADSEHIWFKNAPVRGYEYLTKPMGFEQGLI